ncbi:MAG: transglycosylase domain-containing protein [Saccharofermentans sp.]|mgnify:CR=1 FL=1|nr:transglycosylase domain-containing protein [Mageeibacillus sp.]MCI1264846.1 transglycosylase domain-containing protein [Saccharofermentans sp.]MCI1275697.1 transglycosylase domain-containing protein [Saccharofermentans sp.]
MSSNRSQRSSKPVNPENSALADELRSQLRGKPTRSGFNRSAGREIRGFIWDILRVIIVFVLCFCFLFGGFGSGMLLGYASTTKPLSIGDLTTAEESQTSFVYDSEGNVIAKLTGSENVDRIYVPISQVKNTYMDEAMISIEDERFYEHSGIDLKRIGSALLSALAHGGTATYGGSTITQQTVKLISGQDEHSTSRKVQEWFSAMQLEQNLSKDEILELYMNLAPMGNNYVGVQAAAQNYFGKDASELTLPECALLAGLPKSPSYYNPLRESGRRNALRRMRIILGKMYELGYITEQQYNDALNTEVVFKTQDNDTSSEVNSYFTEYAISEVIGDLAEARGISRSLASTLIYNRGYHIYTTLEPGTQAILDEAFTNQDLFQQDPDAISDYPEKPTGSMVVINTSTGAIAAMQGGYGEKTMNLSLNRATSSYRNPGSSVKPLIDYGPALELGIIAPGTTYIDQECHLDPSNPDAVWPVNYERDYLGPITIRQALVKSRNTIAAQVWTNVGGDTALWYLKQVGIDRTDEGSFPSQSVGGFTKGMTTLEMAAAYNTFASGGTYTAPHAYTQVLDSEGTAVLTADPVSYQVYSPETCFLMADMLKGVVTSGTPSKFGGQITNSAGEHIDTAGKTGTTSDNNDKWFCGFTPYYAAAVWYGYDNRLRQTEIPRADRNNAVRIWMYCMQKIHANLPAAEFVKPDTVISVQVCSSGYYATDACRAAGTTITDYFVTGSALCPTEDNPCPVHGVPAETTPAVDPNATTDPNADQTPPQTVAAGGE